MIGIATIAFNTPAYIEKQYHLCKRFCTDEHEFVVIDNSEDSMVCSARAGDIVWPVLQRKPFPESHRWALKYAVETMCDYEAVLLLDHDVFPVKPFSVIDLLDGHPVAGVKQGRPEIYILYYGPWVFAYRQGVDPDFWTSIPGADTGAGTASLVPEGKDLSEFLCDVQPGGYLYTFVADTFVHFLNGSNWRHDLDHAERIAALTALVDRLADDD